MKGLPQTSDPKPGKNICGTSRFNWYIMIDYPLQLLRSLIIPPGCQFYGPIVNRVCIELNTSKVRDSVFFHVIAQESPFFSLSFKVIHLITRETDFHQLSKSVVFLQVLFLVDCVFRDDIEGPLYWNFNFYRAFIVFQYLNKIHPYNNFSSRCPTPFAV